MVRNGEGGCSGEEKGIMVRSGEGGFSGEEKGIREKGAGRVAAQDLATCSLILLLPGGNWRDRPYLSYCNLRRLPGVTGSPLASRLRTLLPSVVPLLGFPWGRSRRLLTPPGESNPTGGTKSRPGV